MAEKRRFLICYDIVDDKRLRRVHRLLSARALAVQYSVFEAELSLSELQQLGYSLKAGLRSRWLSGVEAGGGIRFDSAQRTTPKLSQLKREANNYKHNSCLALTPQKIK